METARRNSAISIFRIVKIWTWQKKALSAHQTTRRHILAESNLHGHLLQKLRSPCMGNNISRLGYSDISRCRCSYLQYGFSDRWYSDLYIWIIRSPDVGRPLSTSGYSDWGYSDFHIWVFSSPDLGTQDVQVLVLKISRYGYSDSCI
jgi:hypothetical protein